MRKLKLQMQMTINGYVAQHNGKSDWMTWTPDDELMGFMSAMLDTADTLLLGRKTADSIIKYWENTANENPAHPFAKKIAALPKIVFTKSLDESTWSNTALVKENLAEIVTSLKKQKGKDILVFGGASLVSSLINEGLIDEYHFIINPTAISSGMTIFNSFDGVRKFTPIQVKLYPGGKTVLSYKPNNDDDSVKSS